MCIRDRLSRVGEDWATLAPRVVLESERARVAEEALKKQRVERGRAAREERLALEAQEGKSKGVKGFELNRPATPTTAAEPVPARVVLGAFGSPVAD